MYRQIVEEVDFIVWADERGDGSLIAKEIPRSDEWLFESKVPGDQQTVENGLLFASEKRCR